MRATSESRRARLADLDEQAPGRVAAVGLVQELADVIAGEADCLVQRAGRLRARVGLDDVTAAITRSGASNVENYLAGTYDVT